MSQTPAAESQHPPDPVPLVAVAEPPPPQSLTESILDNLSAWTVIAAAVAFLFLVWVTLEVLDRYVGDLPKVGS